MKQVVLEYKRVEDSDSFDGRVRLCDVDSATDEEVATVDRFSFSRMMGLFASALRDNDGAEAVVRRTDREGLVPVRLESAFVQLLKEDPAAAIRAMSPPPRRIIVRQATVPKSVDTYPILRAGSDTLADAFGEEVYLKAANGRVEDPVTGRWRDLININGSVRVGTLSVENLIHNETEDPSKILLGTKWVVVLVAELLKLEAPRFYLPRPWNLSGPWISYKDLHERYTEYLKEKSNVQFQQ